MYPNGIKLSPPPPAPPWYKALLAPDLIFQPDIAVCLLYMGFHFKEVEDIDAIWSVYFHNNLTTMKISIKISIKLS